MPSPQTVGKENPENPYGFSKYVMDQIAARYSSENQNLKISGLRFFNVYGPREFFKGNTSSMVIQLAFQILNGSAPRLFFDSDKIFRDFIYIDDVIQANIKACNSKQNGTYNVGTGSSRSFQDIVNILQLELGTDLKIDYFQNNYKNYQLDTKANISSTKKNLNFSPKFSLEEGIKAYLPEIIRLHKTETL